METSNRNVHESFEFFKSTIFYSWLVKQMNKKQNNCTEKRKWRENTWSGTHYSNLGNVPLHHFLWMSKSIANRNGNGPNTTMYKKDHKPFQLPLAHIKIPLPAYPKRQHKALMSKYTSSIDTILSSIAAPWSTVNRYSTMHWWDFGALHIKKYWPNETSISLHVLIPY